MHCLTSRTAANPTIAPFATKDFPRKLTQNHISYVDSTYLKLMYTTSRIQLFISTRRIARQAQLTAPMAHSVEAAPRPPSPEPQSPPTPTPSIEQSSFTFTYPQPHAINASPNPPSTYSFTYPPVPEQPPLPSYTWPPVSRASNHAAASSVSTGAQKRKASPSWEDYPSERRYEQRYPREPAAGYSFDTQFTGISAYSSYACNHGSFIDSPATCSFSRTLPLYCTPYFRWDSTRAD